MARELVERNGIGESADAIWRTLNTEHQKLFPTASGGSDDAASTETANTPLDTPSDTAGLFEGIIDTGSIFVFGRRPESLPGRKRRERPAVPEQASLFSFG